MVELEQREAWRQHREPRAPQRVRAVRWSWWPHSKAVVHVGGKAVLFPDKLNFRE